jgi:hypothetical protein
VDAAVFPGKGSQPLQVTVEFPDGISDDAATIAQANQLDYNSQSASIEERVRKRNPDWDDPKVEEEVAARQQLSFTTRKRKILGLKPALEGILTKALAVDAAVFPNNGSQALKVVTEFADGVSEDPKAIAESNQLDYNSQSASIEERVRKRNPDWSDELVDAEVARIKDEYGIGQEMADPGTFGIDGAGLESTFPTG